MLFPFDSIVNCCRYAGNRSRYWSYGSTAVVWEPKKSEYQTPNSPISTGRRNATLSILLSCAVLGGIAATASAQTTATPSARPQTVSISTVTVGAPKNAAVWIIPFYNNIYATQASCQAALTGLLSGNPPIPNDPAVQAQTITSAAECTQVGAVPYAFNIGQTEVTTDQ